MEIDLSCNALDSVVIMTKGPSMYNVIFHNDDVTTIEFVIDVLQKLYDMDFTQAQIVTRMINDNGKGVAGTYPYDIAATKAKITIQKARAEGYPLQVTIEKLSEE